MTSTPDGGEPWWDAPAHRPSWLARLKWQLWDSRRWERRGWTTIGATEDERAAR